jgi:hypothetical protein
MISEVQFKQSAQDLRCEVAAIKAVEKVESGGAGFLPDGKPVILFEPHIFWKELRAVGVNPETICGFDDILYPKWGTKPYGKVSQQHARLERAVTIHREAALKSCSWGKFQILGTNWKMCGCTSIQDFINKIYQGEDKHLELFVNYVKSAYLDDELRLKDWKGFARGYNGPLYYKNQYDIKLKKAYESFK